jgi:hypothetical protein
VHTVASGLMQSTQGTPGVTSSRPRIVTLANLLSTLLVPNVVGELLRPLLIGMVRTTWCWGLATFSSCSERSISRLAISSTIAGPGRGELFQPHIRWGCR